MHRSNSLSRAPTLAGLPAGRGKARRDTEWGSGFCHLVPGNQGGPRRVGFGEQRPPAGAPHAPGLREAWGAEPSCSLRKSLCSPEPLERFGKVGDGFLCEVFLLTALLSLVPETREVVCYACSHRLADLPPPTEGQGQSRGPVLVGDGAGATGALRVCDPDRGGIPTASNDLWAGRTEAHGNTIGKPYYELGNPNDKNDKTNW